jgi:predicted nucleic acid-binding protein
MEKNYLVDTNVLFAIFTESDRLNVKAVELMEKFALMKNIKFLIHPLVIIETLSLIKYRSGIEGEKTARKELFDPKKYEILEVKISLDIKTMKIFEKENDIGIIDTILIRYCLDNKIELVTFDKEMERIWKKLRRRN